MWPYGTHRHKRRHELALSVRQRRLCVYVCARDARTCRTRVKQARSQAVGVPKCSVRVTSVVPSTYCAPESHRNISSLRNVE
jgi:hypothetical protein